MDWLEMISLIGLSIRSTNENYVGKRCGLLDSDELLLVNVRGLDCITISACAGGIGIGGGLCNVGCSTAGLCSIAGWGSELGTGGGLVIGVGAENGTGLGVDAGVGVGVGVGADAGVGVGTGAGAAVGSGARGGGSGATLFDT